MGRSGERLWQGKAGLLSLRMVAAKEEAETVGPGREVTGQEGGKKGPILPKQNAAPRGEESLPFCFASANWAINQSANHSDFYRVPSSVLLPLQRGNHPGAHNPITSEAAFRWKWSDGRNMTEHMQLTAREVRGDEWGVRVAAV